MKKADFDSLAVAKRFLLSTAAVAGMSRPISTSVGTSPKIVAGMIGKRLIYKELVSEKL